MQGNDTRVDERTERKGVSAGTKPTQHKWHAEEVVLLHAVTTERGGSEGGVAGGHTHNEGV